MVVDTRQLPQARYLQSLSPSPTTRLPESTINDTHDFQSVKPRVSLSALPENGGHANVLWPRGGDTEPRPT